MSYSKNNTFEIKCLQYEIWQDCNNGCSFCYLNQNRIFTSDEQKIENINKIIDNLDNDISDYNAVGLIGGEFFQGQLSNPAVKSNWLKLIQKINSELLSDKIYEFWITASLMKEDLSDLYDTLDIFDFSKLNENQRILLCTSYDTLGRFHSEEQEKTWKKNIHLLAKKYPELYIHTQIILSEDLIEKTIENPNIFDEILEVSPIDFKIPNYYRDKELAINGIKDYHQLLLDHINEFPKKFFIEHRNTFLQFLPVYAKIFGTAKLKNLINYPKMRSHTLKIFSENYELIDRWNYSEDRFSPCGHLLDGKCYIDSDKCMYCDIERFIETYED